MSETDNLNIREIVNRFQSSADVIDDLRNRLQSLASTDDLHAESLKATQICMGKAQRARRRTSDRSLSAEGHSDDC